MKTSAILLVAFVALQALAFVAYARPNPNQGHTGLRMSAGKFDRIFIIQFENQPYEYVQNDPNFLKYSQMGLLLTNYYAVTHPSQPNVRRFWSVTPSGAPFLPSVPQERSAVPF